MTEKTTPKWSKKDQFAIKKTEKIEKKQIKTPRFEKKSKKKQNQNPQLILQGSRLYINNLQPMLEFFRFG